MFDDIVEVQETYWKNVNDWLAAGYRLLSVSHTSRAARREDDTIYTKRLVTYVVGRTADVPAYAPSSPVNGTLTEAMAKAHGLIK